MVFKDRIHDWVVSLSLWPCHVKLIGGVLLLLEIPLRHRIGFRWFSVMVLVHGLGMGYVMRNHMMCGMKDYVAKVRDW